MYPGPLPEPEPWFGPKPTDWVPEAPAEGTASIIRWPARIVEWVPPDAAVAPLAPEPATQAMPDLGTTPRVSHARSHPREPFSTPGQVIDLVPEESIRSRIPDTVALPIKDRSAEGNEADNAREGRRDAGPAGAVSRVAVQEQSPPELPAQALPAHVGMADRSGTAPAEAVPSERAMTATAATALDARAETDGVAADAGTTPPAANGSRSSDSPLIAAGIAPPPVARTAPVPDGAMVPAALPPRSYEPALPAGASLRPYAPDFTGGGSPPPSPPQSFGASRFDLYRPVTIVMRWLWLVALCSIAAGLAAYFVASRQVPMYRASATLLVNASQDPDQRDGDSYAGQQLADTYSRLVSAGPVRERVASQLQVDSGALGGITGSWVRDTQLINVSVTHPDPGTAATVANAVGRVFGDVIAEAQTGRTRVAEDALIGQLTGLADEIANQRELIRATGNDRSIPADDRIRQVTQQGEELSILRSRQAEVAGQLDRLRVQNAIAPNTVALVNPATQPGVPFAPNVRTNVIAAAFVGALIAGAIAALLEYLDDTVKTAEEVERATGLPTLGVIGRYGPRRERSSGPLLLDNDNSLGSESYRLLRASVEFARASGTEVRSLVFASMLAGEGKSSTLANLAIAYAQTGQQVVMVDGDMRRPALARLFEVPNASGLSTLYLTDADPVSLLYRTSVENLWLLPSGEAPPNPAALLGSARTDSILDALERHADVIFLDTPPALITADATALARYCDGVVLIVDTTRLRAGMLAETARVFAQSGVRVLGVVLNKVSRSSGGYGYGYYGYGYGYGTYGYRGKNGTKTPAAGGTPTAP